MKIPDANVAVVKESQMSVKTFTWASDESQDQNRRHRICTKRVMDSSLGNAGGLASLEELDVGVKVHQNIQVVWHSEVLLCVVKDDSGLYAVFTSTARQHHK